MMRQLSHTIYWIICKWLIIILVKCIGTDFGIRNNEIPTLVWTSPHLSTVLHGHSFTWNLCCQIVFPREFSMFSIFNCIPRAEPAFWEVSLVWRHGGYHLFLWASTKSHILSHFKLLISLDPSSNLSGLHSLLLSVLTLSATFEPLFLSRTDFSVSRALYVEPWGTFCGFLNPL